LSSQKEKKKRSIEDKKQLLIFSRKINNSLSSLTTMKVARVIKQKSAKHVKIFSSSIEMMRDEKIKFFKKNNFVTFVQALRTFFKVKVYTIYKRKNQKIKLSDICVSDDFKSNDDVS
jgi:predicted methyltransferase